MEMKEILSIKRRSRRRHTGCLLTNSVLKPSASSVRTEDVPQGTYLLMFLPQTSWKVLPLYSFLWETVTKLLFSCIFLKYEALVKLLSGNQREIVTAN